jgi:hypothetical protein
MNGCGCIDRIEAMDASDLLDEINFGRQVEPV